MGTTLDVLIAGMASGASYAILLLGILLIYRVSRAVNFAHGQFGMVAAFVAYALVGQGSWGLVPALMVGLGLAVILSAATEVFLVRPLQGRASGTDLVVTLGVMLVLTAAVQMKLGGQSHGFMDLANRTQIDFLGRSVNANDVIVVGLAVALTAATWLVWTRTSVGQTLRAVALRPDVARSCGINVALVRTATWGVAGLLAGLAGVLVASRLSVDAFYMTPVLLKAFIAGMIGGLDRLWAPVIVAVLLGIYENFVAYELGPQWATPSVFLLVIVVLSVAPGRLIQENVEARA